MGKIVGMVQCKSGNICCVQETRFREKLISKNERILDLFWFPKFSCYLIDIVGQKFIKFVLILIWEEYFLVI